MTQITLLDGGISRELQRLGATLRQPEWSALALMNEPEKVREAHASFIAAGAEVVTTNSYAVVPFHIGAERFAARGAALAALAGQLAREAAEGTGARVAGSLPPACGSYIPDQFDPVVARDILGVLVAAMAPFVDLWLAETMSSLEEARVTAEVAGTDKPLWLAYTLRDDDPSAPPLLRSGEPVAEAVALARDLGAAAVLFNCSSPEVMAAAVAVARETAPALPVGVYANAFATQHKGSGANESLAPIRADLDPRAYAAWVETWIAAGATLVGGCCGINAPHIAALRAVIDAR